MLVPEVVDPVVAEEDEFETRRGKVREITGIASPDLDARVERATRADHLRRPVERDVVICEQTKEPGGSTGAGPEAENSLTANLVIDRVDDDTFLGIDPSLH